MHTPIRSLPLRADYDLTTVYGSALHYFAKSVVGEKKNRMPGKCTFRINGAPFPRQRCKRLAPAVRYPFVVTC